MQIWKEAICRCKCINCFWLQIFIWDLFRLRPQFSQDRLMLLFDITSDHSKYFKKVCPQAFSIFQVKERRCNHQLLWLIISEKKIPRFANQSGLRWSRGLPPLFLLRHLRLGVKWQLPIKIPAFLPHCPSNTCYKPSSHLDALDFIAS